jgi:hypothetical protein
MEPIEATAPATADLRQLLTLCAETVRILDEAPGPLRQLRLHCLRERSQALLASLEPPRPELARTGQ